MYIGEIIKEYRIKNNLSQRAFAKRTSLSPSYINTLEKIFNPKNGKPYSVTTDVALEIANATSTSIKDLLDILDKGQELEASRLPNSFLSNQICTSVPIIKTVKAGYDYFANENIIGTINIPQNLASLGDFFALKVKDDCMYPAIIEDDFVIVRKQDDFENGDIVLAMINGDEAIIRKAKKSNAGILLQPLNTNYEPLIFSFEDIKSKPVIIVGVVKRLERQF